VFTVVAVVRMASTATWAGVVGGMDSIALLFEEIFFFAETTLFLFVLLVSIDEVACCYEFKAS
jgi:hypothetical protein